MESESKIALIFSVNLVCEEEMNLMLVKGLVNKSRCGGFKLIGTDSYWYLDLIQSESNLQEML